MKYKKMKWKYNVKKIKIKNAEKNPNKFIS